MKDPKWEDFYSTDGKIEYCYDRFGNKYEAGSSFKGGPMGIKSISCPICRACKNEYFVEEGFELLYKAYGKIPEDVGKRRVFKCEHFIPDEESYDYELVKKFMEEHKND